MIRSTWTLAALAVILCGCSFHEGRVRQAEERIAELRTELESAPAEERPALLVALEREEARREEAMEGVHREGERRQALLMAVIAIVTGGLKMASGLAAKGAGG